MFAKRKSHTERSLEVAREDIANARDNLIFSSKNEVFNTVADRYIFKCKNCNKEFSGRFKDVLANRVHCPHCTDKSYGKRIPRGCTEAEFKKLIETKVKEEGFNFTYESGYINSKSKVTFKCIRCGQLIERVAKDFLRPDACGPKRCPHCQGTRRGAHLIKDDYLTNILRNSPDGKDYIWLDTYKGDNKAQHRIKHISCGNIFEIRPNDFQQGYRCQKCKSEIESSLTEIFEKEIKKHNFPNLVIFKEYKLADGKPYDYYIPGLNNLIVEIDGRQHFGFLTPDPSIYKNREPEKVRKKDVIRNTFIATSETTKEYIFLRIPYIHFVHNIEAIVNELFSTGGFLNKAFCQKYNLYYIRHGKKIACKHYYENIRKFYNS